MTNITSETKRVDYSAEKVYQFITDFNNFESLLPQDKVENFKADGDTCSFRIKGMTDLGLKIVDAKKHSRIDMVSNGKVPFPFKMNVLIESPDDSNSDVRIEFEGDINPFMKMMVEKPLTNFFNMLVDRLTQLELD